MGRDISPIINQGVKSFWLSALPLQSSLLKVGTDGRVNAVSGGVEIAGALGFTPANDAAVVHKTGAETVAGTKTFTSPVQIGTYSTISSVDANVLDLNVWHGLRVNYGNGQGTPLAIDNNGVAKFKYKAQFPAATGGTGYTTLNSGIDLNDSSPGTTGLQYWSGNLALWMNNVLRLNISTNNDLRLPSNHSLGWASDTGNAAAADSIFKRVSAGVLGVYQADGTTLGHLRATSFRDGQDGLGDHYLNSITNSVASNYFALTPGGLRLGVPAQVAFYPTASILGSPDAIVKRVSAATVGVYQSNGTTKGQFTADSLVADNYVSAYQVILGGAVRLRTNYTDGNLSVFKADATTPGSLSLGSLQVSEGRITGSAPSCFIDLYNPTTGQLVLEGNSSQASPFGDIVLRTAGTDRLRVKSSNGGETVFGGPATFSTASFITTAAPWHNIYIKTFGSGGMTAGNHLVFESPAYAVSTAIGYNNSGAFLVNGVGIAPNMQASTYTATGLSYPYAPAFALPAPASGNEHGLYNNATYMYLTTNRLSQIRLGADGVNFSSDVVFQASPNGTRIGTNPNSALGDLNVGTYGINSKGTITLAKAGAAVSYANRGFDFGGWAWGQLDVSNNLVFASFTTGEALSIKQAGGSQLTGKLDVKRTVFGSFSSGAYVQCINANGYVDAEFSEGLIAAYGGVMSVRDGTSLGTGYARFEYNGGYPQFKTSQQTFGFLGNGFQMTMTNAYGNWFIGGTEWFRLDGSLNTRGNIQQSHAASALTAPSSRFLMAAQGKRDLQVGDGAGTWQTGYREEYNAGGLRCSLYGATPVAKQTAAAAATDAATTQALANSLRTILINLGACN